MFQSFEKRGLKQEGEARVVKSETRTVTRGGVTETVTTEVYETYTSGGEGASKTVRTVTSQSGRDDHQQLSAQFGSFAIDEKEKKTTTTVRRQLEVEESFGGDDDEKEKKASKLHALMSKFGGNKGGDKEQHREKKKKAADSSDSDHDDNDDEFAKVCLKVHNEKRKLHGTQALKLSKKLNSYAKEWAEKLAKDDAFRHRDNNKYGENIYMKWSSNPKHKISGGDAVDSWYDEIRVHEFGREPSSLKSGHFTQVIWKGTKEMGVAQAKSKSGKIIVVANYEPAGNFVGTFAENVPAPL